MRKSTILDLDMLLNIYEFSGILVSPLPGSLDPELTSARSLTAIPQVSDGQTIPTTTDSFNRRSGSNRKLLLNCSSFLPL
jgi:hypothetical protein